LIGKGDKLMKNQKIRSMKVHEQSGYNYKATPTIILKGQWLKEMGFEIGDYITVSCEEGKLIITPDAEKAAMAKAEAEFMEKGMKKLDALEDMIEAANGRPVMVAYWFKHDLSRIMRRLTEKKIPFEKLDSEESIRKWNRGELQVALIHPASAGHGLNLQSGGNMLIWFGLTWSLELYQQTVARLWRQGQTSETVVVQHIITAGTIDEDVMKALASKDMTQNRLIAAVKARVTHGR